MRLNKLVLLMSLLLINTIGFSQQIWRQFYKDKKATTFARTLNNNFVLSGWENVDMRETSYIFQTDSLGKLEWDTTFTGGYEIRPVSIIPSIDSGFVVAGNIEGDLCLVKFDKSNNLCWESMIEETNYKGNLSSLVKSQEDGYVAIGRSNNSVKELFLAKFNEDGANIWTKQHSYGRGISIVKSLDSTGYFCLSMTNEVYLTKVTDKGNVVWSKKLNIINNVESMILTADNCLVIKASESSPSNIIFAKFNLNGTKIWEKEYSIENSRIYCNYFTECLDRGFISISKITNLKNQYQHLWILKLNEKGDSVFSFSTTEYLYSNRILETENNQYVFAATGINESTMIKMDFNAYVHSSIPFIEAQNDIKLFPNPVKNELNISLCNPINKKGFYQLFNSSGILVIQNKLNQSTKIEMQDLTNGLYTLNIYLEDKVISKKILK